MTKVNKWGHQSFWCICPKCESKYIITTKPEKINHLEKTSHPDLGGKEVVLRYCNGDVCNKRILGQS